MKKAISVFICLIWMVTSSAAAAERHISVQFVLTGSLSGKVVSADLYEQGDQVYAESTLIPDYAVILKKNSANNVLLFADLLSAVDPEALRYAVSIAEQLIDEWISQQPSFTVSGYYAGELFDSAETKNTCEFFLSDFETYVRTRIGELKEDALLQNQDGTNAFLILELLADSMKTYSGQADPVIRFQSYDNGSYCSVLILAHDHVITTMSADRSREDARKAVIQFAEEGRYYYQEFDWLSEAAGITLSASLRGSAESAWRKAAQSPALYTQSISIHEYTDSHYSFDYILRSGKISEPLHMTGSNQLSGDGFSVLKAKVYPEGNEKDGLDVSLSSEPMRRDVSFPDKRIMRMENATESAVIRLTILSGAARLASDVMSLLPESYQEIITSIIFQ